MKKLITICLVMIMLLSIIGVAQASVTFNFDPVDFFNYKPVSEGFSTDGGMFKLHTDWGVDMYRSWTNDGGQRTVVDNWASGLGADEGINGFNIWLLDNPNARAWGEKMVWDPSGPTPTGTAPPGWSVEVIENPWGPGWLIDWSTTDPSEYIRPGNSVGLFSFNGTAYWDNNENGYDITDPLVSIGEFGTVWFGGYYVAADAGADPGFEATLSLPAVPAPGAILLGSIGLGFVGWLRRRGTL